jgi:hypothetical protein
MIMSNSSSTADTTVISSNEKGIHEASHESEAEING